MPANHYGWSLNGTPPNIDEHSVVKHEVLQEYLKNYVRILASHPRSKGLKLTVIDGFAGGGIYTDWNGHERLGSPLLMIEGVKEGHRLAIAERLAKGVPGQYSLDAQFHFVEIETESCAVLKRTLSDRSVPFGEGTNVQVHHASFGNFLDQLIRVVKNHQRAGRSLIVLDQYTYSQVCFDWVRRILAELPSAEVIVTFMLDDLVNFLGKNTNIASLRSSLAKAGLAELIDAERLLNIKEADANWRRVIQTLLADKIRQASGAAFMTPFYIIRAKSNRGYWLLHFAGELRANQEMKRIHWELQNHFGHPAGPGLDMLRWRPANGQFGIDFGFDSHAARTTLDALCNDIPRFLAGNGREATYRDFLAHTANDTPAHDALIRQALTKLIDDSEIDVHPNESGGRRRTAATIKADDRILLKPKQFVFDLAAKR